MPPFSAVFVIGPSGAGKSQISEWIVEDLHYLLVDVDGRNVFRKNRLRKEWDQFSCQLDPGPLVSALHNRITAENYIGAVLSFPSTTILTREQIDCARSANITTVLLWGPKEYCMKAALERTVAPVSSEEGYERSNRNAFDTYGSSMYDDLRVQAFDLSGNRWPREHMMRIVRGIIAG